MHRITLEVSIVDSLDGEMKIVSGGNMKFCAEKIITFRAFLHSNLSSAEESRPAEQPV
jgi:hypothetical protein